MMMIWPNGPWLRRPGPRSRDALDPAALDGARLGIWRDPSAPAGAATGAVLDMAVAKLRSLGAVVVDPVTLPDTGKIPSRSSPRCGTSSSTGSTPTWPTSPTSVSPGPLPRTLAELIDFNKRNADLVLSRFGQETFEQSEATSGDLTDRDYLAARREATRLARTAISTPLAEHGLEAIVALTANPACLTDYVLGDHDVFHTSGPAAVAGCPSITVPGRVRVRPAGRRVVLRPALDRAAADRPGLRLRAGHLVRQVPALAPASPSLRASGPAPARRTAADRPRASPGAARRAAR